MRHIGSLVPDGKSACTLLDGHQGRGIRACKDERTGHEWCGYCGTWNCVKHGITGYFFDETLWETFWK